MEIRVDHLTKRYGKTLALDALSFPLAAGRVTGLVGPNGAGKSTLLRLMAGREAPDDGEITYDGVSVVEYPERLAGIVGFMPDSLPNSIYWKVGVYLDFYARANGLMGEERRRRVDEILRFTHLETLVDKRLSTLSKGMKQRVSLARVLCGNPQVLLLDEPASGLDPRARIELRGDIRQLAEQGKTILISSHILPELEDMCDEMIIMELGHIRKRGSMAELESAPSPEMAAAALPQITLEFPEVTEALSEQLQKLPHVKSLAVATRHSVTVTIDGDDQAVDAFMAAVFAAHLPILAFSRGRNLESVFMDTTTGALQ